MSNIKKVSLVVSVVVSLTIASCTRSPEEDRVTVSDELPSSSVESASSRRAEEPSGRASEPLEAGEVATYTGDANDLRTAGVEQYLDINSGDVKEVRSFWGAPARTTISESRLSKEVRRLGIFIPEAREWKVLYADPVLSDVQIGWSYPRVLAAADRLLAILNKTRTPDKDRRAILERFMASLRTDTPLRAAEQTDALVVEVTDQHGLESIFFPAYTEHLRELGKQKAQ